MIFRIQDLHHIAKGDTHLIEKQDTKGSTLVSCLPIAGMPDYSHLIFLLKKVRYTAIVDLTSTPERHHGIDLGEILRHRSEQNILKRASRKKAEDFLRSVSVKTSDYPELERASREEVRAFWDARKK